METSLEKLIDELNSRMRLLKTIQENGSALGSLTDRDLIILKLLDERGRLSVSEIIAANPHVSDSTISTDITKLWREKKMVSKTISPENQRVTMVELTQKGRDTVELIRKQRTDRLKAFFDAIEVSTSEREVLKRVFGRALAYLDEHLDLAGAGMRQRS